MVESSSNETVLFNVELPDTAFEAEHSGKKQATILIVEDNRDLNNYICSCLADKYNVIGVTNGEEALAKAINLLPNLIITDLMMPKMNGIELIRQLKKDMNTSISLSSWSLPRRVQTILKRDTPPERTSTSPNLSTLRY